MRKATMSHVLLLNAKQERKIKPNQNQMRMVAKVVQG